MIRLSEINLKNVKAFWQGMCRYYWDKWFPNSFPKHIREQVAYRKKEANEDCVKNGECLECGCKIPHLFYADKSCNGDCYPVMMKEFEWECHKAQIVCEKKLSKGIKEKEAIVEVECSIKVKKPKKKRNVTKKTD